jgi:hypothetical protein
MHRQAEDQKHHNLGMVLKGSESMPLALVWPATAALRPPAWAAPARARRRAIQTGRGKEPQRCGEL